MRTDEFRSLHAHGSFVMPNPWDAGSARILAAAGFPALATTSSGLAASLGRRDQRVNRAELVAHVVAVAGSVTVPLNVDAEHCYPDDPGGITATIAILAEAGAAGCSIEDYIPDVGILPVEEAARRVAVAAEAAAPYGLVLTARAENHLYGTGDLDDTVSRLIAYREAGAEVVYPPGLVDLADISRVVEAVGVPVNILLTRSGPTAGEMAAAGVRRVSTGGSLARLAYAALADASGQLASTGRLPDRDGTHTNLGDLVDP
jgi:2-methylisocitrate lyase-like PEP mutase family enzyme